jgi:DNA-binding transcriptional LysR family regulator
MGEFSMKLFVSDGYLRTFGAPGNLEELSRHRIGIWRIAGRPRDSIPLRSGAALSVEPRLISDDPVALQEGVRAGDCIGYLPALPRLEDPALKVLFEDEVGGTVRQSLYVPHALADVPRVASFVELCRGPDPSSQAFPA